MFTEKGRAPVPLVLLGQASNKPPLGTGLFIVPRYFFPGLLRDWTGILRIRTQTPWRRYVSFQEEEIGATLWQHSKQGADTCQWG